MDSLKYTALFVTESRDHLQQCNQHLLAWEGDASSIEPVQGLFRSVHTLKGMAAALNFTRLANLAHAFEHVLSAVRGGQLAVSAELIDAAFHAVDALERGVALAAHGSDADLDSDGMIADLGRLARPETGTWPIPVARREPESPPPSEGVAVRVRLRPGTIMPGARAVLVLRRATSLGPVSAVQPPPETWNGDVVLGEFSCRIATGLGDAEIRGALRDVGDVEEVVIQRGNAPAAGAGGPRQVRVELRRLDALVALAGELGAARSRLGSLLERRGDPALEAEGHHLARLVGELQEQVLQTRMAPVGELFERFPRAVRDLARQLGKQVRLDVAGSDIELDRAILDELPDALLHLLRNALDHGIEAPEARQAAGKPVEGWIRLQAQRDRNAVLISVADDGRGVDRDAVLARAAQEGWLGGDEGELGAEELLRILARPGFSTASEVTDVSGRGVGIDAVVHRVRALGGATELSSRPGIGTTVTLRLPLTVAIVPALLVRIGEGRYAVPLGFVAETTRLASPADPGGSGTVEFRGRALRIIELGAAWRPGWRPGVILDVAGRQGALAVDTLLGQEDIVVGPLDAPRGMPRWINGATIISDGVPALILDPTALV